MFENKGQQIIEIYSCNLSNSCSVNPVSAQSSAIVSLLGGIYSFELRLDNTTPINLPLFFYIQKI